VVRQQGVPECAGRGVAEAGVDEGPAVGAAQEPQVDVIEREGSGIRTQRTPSATSVQVAGAGSSGNGNSRLIAASPGRTEGVGGIGSIDP
jgi:hypothetical protein